MHHDVVGSLLRPDYLLRAQEDAAEGRLSAAELKKTEDRAVDEAVALQEDVGLEVVTDGEMRRVSFQSQMTSAVEGFSEHGLDTFLWGRWHSVTLGDWTVSRPSLRIVSKLHKRRSLCAEELTYLRARTRKLPKITIPSPTLFVHFWSPDRKDLYSTLDSFLADLVAVLRDEIRELLRLGATYIQVDAPHYTSLLDPSQREYYLRQGWSVDEWLERGIELENAVMEGFPEVTFGFHL